METGSRQQIANAHDKARSILSPPEGRDTDLPASRLEAAESELRKTANALLDCAQEREAAGAALRSLVEAWYSETPPGASPRFARAMIDARGLVEEKGE